MHPSQNKYPASLRVHSDRFPRSKRQPGTRVSTRRPHRIRLDSAISEYLSEVQARCSLRAADRLRWLLTDFHQSYPKSYLEAITRQDLIGYMGKLRERGLADRTIFNRISTLLCFLRAFGID